MDTQLLKRAGVILAAAMLLLTASCGQAGEDDTLSAVVKVYEETAERFIIDGNYDSAIEVLEEGIKETDDEGLADLLEKAKARKAEQTSQSGGNEQNSGAGALAPSQNADAPTWSTALSGIAYFGDPSACTMTRVQAEAYAQLLESEIKQVFDIKSDWSAFGNGSAPVPRAYAALLDLGNGIPALLFGSGVEITYDDRVDLMTPLDSMVWGIWQLMGDQPVKMENQNATFVYADHIYVDDYYLRAELTSVDAKVYPIENGQIILTPSTNISVGYEQPGYIDGQQATEEQVNAWFDQWNPDNSLAGYTHGSDRGVEFWGMSPAEDVLDAINRALSGSTDTSWPDASVASNIPVEIQRSNMYPDNDSVEIYFEIPSFPSGGPVYQSITNFFSAKHMEFIDSNFGIVEDLPEGMNYWNTCSTSVVGRTSKLICFMLQSSTGVSTGAHPFSSTKYYTFRMDTGERVYLSDIVNASPEEIQSFLLSALSAIDAETNDGIDMDVFRAYGADDYGFSLQDGKVYVQFDHEEGVPYAYGVIEPIEMTMGLKPEWQD